jgi:arylsulfatase A-like enzyme
VPSILLVVVDALRANLLARPSGAWPRTSALVERGARFRYAYTTCPTTTPAVTAMFTGRYPSAHGVRALRGARLADDIPTIAGELAKGGYDTWCSATGPLLDNVGVLRGFAETEYRDVPERSVHDEWGQRLVERVRASARTGEPYFGVVHVWDMHGPRRYPERFDSRRYGRDVYERSLAGIDAWLGQVIDAAGEDGLIVLTGDHGQNTRLEPRTLAQQRLMQALMRRLPTERWGTRAVARGVRSPSKRLLRLAPRQLWPHNQTLFEHLVHVPLVVTGPGIVAGARSTPVSHVDLAPTFQELAGLPEPVPAWPGVSLAGSLRSGDEPPDHPVAMEIGPGAPGGVESVVQQAIRDASWKLVTSLENDRVADALYDLEADPGERRNVAAGHPEVVARLKDRLRTLLTDRADAVAMAEEDDAVLAARLEELGYL